MAGSQTPAQDSEPEKSALPTRYEVELIIFRHLDQSGNTPEIPAAASMVHDSPFELQLAEIPTEESVLAAGDAVAGRQPWTTAADDEGHRLSPGRREQVVSFLLLSPRAEWPDFFPSDQKSFALNEVYNRINRLNAYEPLIHLGWVQPAMSTDEARPFRIVNQSNGPVAVTGTVTLYKERYLHLALDLALDSRLADEAAEPAAETPPQRVFRLNMPVAENKPAQQTNAIHKLQQTRRIRISKTQYFDHPLFGVIATVSEIEETASTPDYAQPDTG
jgi:hypothetical protein